MVSSETLAKLKAAADEAAEHAYAPYSGFRVGAALLFEDGAIVSGCNVENVSYSLTICAERTALVRAIAEGRVRKIVAVAVTNSNGAPSPPCGACLQMLSEFTIAETKVHFANGTGMTEKRFDELMPYQFKDWKSDARS